MIWRKLAGVLQKPPQKEILAKRSAKIRSHRMMIAMKSPAPAISRCRSEHSSHQRFRFLIVIVSAVLLSAAQSEEPAAKDYHVSKSGTDQATLKRIFEAVAAIEAADVPKGENFEVTRIVDSKQVVVFRRVMRPGADGVLKEQTDYKTACWLILSDEKNLKEGAILKGVFAVNTGETKSDLAGTYEVFKAEQKPALPPFTRENFIFHLKAGRTWLLPKFGKEKCPSCFGDGKLGALHKYRRCGDCRGTGTTVVNYRVRW